MIEEVSVVVGSSGESAMGTSVIVPAKRSLIKNKCAKIFVTEAGRKGHFGDGYCYLMF